MFIFQCIPGMSVNLFHCFRTLSFIFLLPLLLLISLPLPARDREAERDALLHDFMLEAESGPVDRRLVRELAKLARRGDIRATGLLVWYDAERGELRDALEKLVPLLLQKAAADSFSKELSRIKSDNELGPLLERLPPAASWDGSRPELCICLARVLAAAGSHRAALAGFDRIGEKHEGVPRVLAAEGLGDMQFQLKSWPESVENYEFALKVIGWLKKQSDYLNDPDRAVDLLRKRISAKLAKALEAWDAERYGPGFVAYRRARREELGANHILAAALYAILAEEFPDTVYAEAAVCYRGKCLLALSERDNAQQAEKYIGEKSARLNKEEKELERHEKQMTIRVRELYRSQLGDDRALLAAMKEVPVGKKAAAAAVTELGKFIAADEFGLYRGEAMQLLGDYHLETGLDVEKAYEHYGRCYKWLGECRRFRDALSDRQVPDKAAWVTRPPSTEKKLVGWTQWIEKNPLKPEQIINRVHCPWYLDSLRARNGKMLSLCFFIKGDQEQALKAAKAVIKYEALERRMYEQGQFNSYSRLVRGYTLGWMRSPPAELELFTGRQRVAVVLGDFYYEIEDESRCEDIRRKLAAGELGKLSRSREAAAKYRLAEILHRRAKREEATALLRELCDRRFRTTPSSPEIMIAAGNIYYSKNDDEAVREAVRCYAEAAARAEDPLREKAMYYHASTLLRLGERGKAAGIYKQLLKQYPESRYRTLAAKDLAELEK